MNAEAQDIGARAHAMGNTSACLSDVWSIHNNVAGLADVKNPEAAASYYAIPAFRPFDRVAMSVALPIAGGIGGCSVFRLGDELYSEHIISIGYSTSFGLASLGLKGNYLQYRASGQETRKAATMSFGGLATLTPHILFGAHIININQSVINTATDEKLSTVLIAGIAFTSPEKFIASIEIEKEIQLPVLLKVGFEYKVLGKVPFRAGFNFPSRSASVGFGAKLRRIQVDCATQVHDAFGITCQASATYQLKRK